MFKLKNEEFTIGKVYVRENGSQVINIGKGAPLVFPNKSQVKIISKGRGFVIKPL